MAEDCILLTLIPQYPLGATACFFDLSLNKTITSLIRFGGIPVRQSGTKRKRQQTNRYTALAKKYPGPMPPAGTLFLIISLISAAVAWGYCCLSILLAPNSAG